MSDHGPRSDPLDEAMRRAARRLRDERLIAEQEDFLENAASRYSRVESSRAFLDVVATKLKDRDEPALRKWVRWSQDYCDAIDPLSESGLASLGRFAAELEPPPDLPPLYEEEQIWRDMGLLDHLLDAEDEV